MDQSENPFGTWLDGQLRARGVVDNYSEAGRLFGVPATTVRNWLTKGTKPSLETLRSIAAGLKLPYLSVLVGAGVVTEDEADVRVYEKPLSEVPLEDMFGEIKRRTTS